MHRLTIMTAFALACTLASCDHAPWSTPTPTHEGDALAPTLYLEKPQAGTAIDVLNNHHDWTECINVKVTRRDVSKSCLPSSPPFKLLSPSPIFSSYIKLLTILTPLREQRPALPHPFAAPRRYPLHPSVQRRPPWETQRRALRQRLQHPDDLLPRALQRLGSF